ncbi:hypothetical protein Bca4012_034685 [Brassica carinata]
MVLDPFTSSVRLAHHWRYRYKLRGVHRKLATPETTWEVPASEATRRTSPSRDHCRWLRTATDS